MKYIRATNCVSQNGHEFGDLLVNPYQIKFLRDTPGHKVFISMVDSYFYTDTTLGELLTRIEES